MPKTLYERDVEDSLRQIAVALGVDVSRAPDVENVIRAAGKAGKDAERYRKWRAAFTSERDEDVMYKLADAWEPEAVDAVLDAAPAVGAA